MNPDLAMKLSVIANNCTGKNNDPCFFFLLTIKILSTPTREAGADEKVAA